MTNEIAQIAARIKELRLLEGEPAEALASACGISPETYTLYEEGQTDIPVGVLHVLAKRHNVEITTLLTGEDPKLHHFALTRKEKGVVVERRKDYHYQSLAYNFVHRKAEPFLVTIEASQDKIISYNCHPGQEFNYVLEGTLLISIGGKTLTLEEGDSVYYDSGQPHGMAAAGGKPLKFLSIIF
ncbi:MAG: cupin domain-containing protein [Spirochaetales bacterium]|jgi:quercetin dioxygenase-like cupin family protein/DNA-binding XRE family transcriptional regulator|nr:cupin domain-containing protein [Spirochaetales bacterium]